MKLFIQWARLHKIKFAMLVLSAIACAATLRWDLTLGFILVALLYGMWATIYIWDTAL